MDAIATLIAIVVGLIGFGIAATGWGHDSRDIRDDARAWTIH